MPISREAAVHRGKLGGLKRAAKNGERPADDPAIPELERELAVTLLAEKAAALVAKWPDITDAQRDRLVTIVRGGRHAT